MPASVVRCAGSAFGTCALPWVATILATPCKANACLTQWIALLRLPCSINTRERGPCVSSACIACRLQLSHRYRFAYCMQDVVNQPKVLVLVDFDGCLGASTGADRHHQCSKGLLSCISEKL